MRALRAAGLTLAGAERLSQTRAGSNWALIGLSAAVLCVMAGIGVYSVNLPAPDAPPPIQASAPEPAPVVAAVDPAPAPTLALPTITAEPKEALPWVTALVEAPVAQAQAPTPVAAAPEVDCITTLAQQAAAVRLQFGAGSATVPSESFDILATIGAMTVDCPAARVQVAGHSDSSGSDLANLQLSWERAENTIEALSALGFDTRQFETVGFGSRAPLEQGSSSDDGINRRVELRVLKGEGTQ
ncbi:MAG: OmpA family protein [Pseudomonadota bacterium]